MLGGRTLLRLIDVATVRKMTAAVLLILGPATAVSALASAGRRSRVGRHRLRLSCDHSIGVRHPWQPAGPRHAPYHAIALGDGSSSGPVTPCRRGRRAYRRAEGACRARTEPPTSANEPRVHSERPVDPQAAELRAERNPLKRLGKVLGPGLITGASDDDPSGIGTYAQAGAQYGFATLWTTVVMLPMMTAAQYMCAEIGLVTGRGLAGGSL